MANPNGSSRICGSATSLISWLVSCVAANIRPGFVTLRRPPRRTARVRLRGLATSGLGRKPCQDGLAAPRYDKR